MAIKKEEIKGTKIICEIVSTNINRTELDTETGKLIFNFNNGTVYEDE